MNPRRGTVGNLHVANTGILQPGKTWMAAADIAHIIRFMQDQPMCHHLDIASGSARFVTRVAASIDVTGLSEEQIAAIERAIAHRGWTEPPRWRPWTSIVDVNYFDQQSQTWKTGPVYRVTMCAGSPPAEINELIRARPAETEAMELYIGPLYESTNDIDDPRLERTPSEKRRGFRERYTTVCRRLVNEARERGLLIT